MLMPYYAIGYVDCSPGATMHVARARYTSVDDALESIWESSYGYAMVTGNYDLVRSTDEGAKVEFRDGSYYMIYREA